MSLLPKPHHHAAARQPARWLCWLADLPLAAKTAALAGITGTLSAVIAVTAMLAWQHVDRRYQTRLMHETQSALQLGAVSARLSDVSREVLVTPGIRRAADMHRVCQLLLQIQLDLQHELSAIRLRTPDLMLAVDFIDQRSQRLLQLGHQVVEAMLHLRSDHARLLIEHNFVPGMRTLRHDIEKLEQHTLQNRKTLALTQELARKKIAVLTLLGVVLSILAVSALAAWLAVRWVSRPIARMTQSMERLTQRHYDLPLPETGRHDEVGTMATALRVFRDSMLHNEQLALQVAHARTAALLSGQLLELTRALPAGIFQLHIASDGQSALRFVTPRWEAAVRHTLTPGHCPLLWQMLLDSCSTLDAVDCDLQCVLRTGQPPVWVRVLATARRSAGGGTLFHGSLIDISQEKSQAHALQQARHDAETAARTQARFLATISHEIRTPLNAILGMTQLLLRGPLNAAQQRQMESVHRAGRHLRSLANDVLDFSRTEARQMTLEHTDFSLQQLVNDVLSMCQQEAAGKGLPLDCRLDAGLPAWLRGDPVRITQALLNLVHNAIKFTARGRVRIRVQALPLPGSPQLSVQFTVSDTGPGLSQADTTRLFLPFEQLDASITRRFGGAGLGLTIAQRLARLMQGDAGVRSRPGRGSRFWLTALLEPSHAPAPPQAPVEHALPPARVLLVDDHPVNLDVLEGFLAAAGMRTHRCEDGQEALEHLQSLPSGHYQAVLMDLQMPRLGGWSTCRRLRADPRFQQLPVLAMTARTSQEDLRLCTEAGMDGHIAKPVLESALWSALERVLNHSPTPGDRPLAAAVALPAVPPPLPEFSPAALDTLAATLPPDTVRLLAQRFVQDLEARLRALHLASQAGDLVRVQHLAHQIAGTADTFGLVRLGALATALAQAPDLATARSGLGSLFSSAESGMGRLQQLLPDPHTAAG